MIGIFVSFFLAVFGLVLPDAVCPWHWQCHRFGWCSCYHRQRPISKLETNLRGVWHCYLWIFYWYHLLHSGKQNIKDLCIFPFTFLSFFFTIFYEAFLRYQNFYSKSQLRCFSQESSQNSKILNLLNNIDLFDLLCIFVFKYLQGGQFILELVDYYAGSFVVFILATLEITGIFWVYGLENFLDDVEYMLQRRPSMYWRLCWGVLTPLLLAVILIYTMATLRPLQYSGVYYPDSAYSLYNF